MKDTSITCKDVIAGFSRDKTSCANTQSICWIPNSIDKHHVLQQHSNTLQMSYKRQIAFANRVFDLLLISSLGVQQK